MSSATPQPLSTARLLPLLIVGQIALHAAMAGQRMATPLQALKEGHSAWSVGVLLALFAALPALIALPAGRMADRHGYHRPQRLAVVLTLVGVSCALAACWLSGWAQFTLQCVGAAASGAGTNVGVIVVLRTAGQLGGDSTERLRIFSWLGMAFSMANVVGPVAAGLMIDAAGFAAAYGLLLAMPLVAVAVMRLVPVQPRPAAAAPRLPGASRWDLLATPGLKRLLFINWLLSASWDVHSFAVPVLGHARGYSASTIGLVLGIFTAAITVVRFIVPLLAHRLKEVTVLRAAMVMTAGVFALYPFAATPWLMAGCATLLGLALGAVQPMIMSTLHHLTPPNRHGEAIAFRSMTINFSSSVMPLAFGLAGTALGPAAVFWLMGAAVGGGSWAVKGLARVFATPVDTHPLPPAG
ncbi:MAG: MFS transporter [Burkholderiales bacterium RIFCSPHIGHO2_12_FULL_69_20]|nr:MAG: MFS transporter [Burkholderiales bacterium RIFCSPHIGHO2_12_FULL_69_20]